MFLIAFHTSDTGNEEKKDHHSIIEEHAAARAFYDTMVSREDVTSAHLCMILDSTEPGYQPKEEPAAENEKTVYVLFHPIRWWVQHDVLDQLPESELERIEDMIIGGFREGSIVIYIPVNGKETQVCGWWKIV